MTARAKPDAAAALRAALGPCPGSPLEVLLAAMRLKWGEGALDGAAALALQAAPYEHGRGTGRGAPTRCADMTDAELSRWIADAELAQRSDEPGEA